jgi:hypothetical protein
VNYAVENCSCPHLENEKKPIYESNEKQAGMIYKLYEIIRNDMK